MHQTIQASTLQTQYQPSAGQAVQSEITTFQNFSAPGLMPQLESCIRSFFSGVADISLQSVQSDMAAPVELRTNTAIINFGGSEQGFFAIDCTDAIAQKLATGMLGEGDELPDSCLDSALEVASDILTTSLLKIAFNEKQFRISTPTIIRNDSALQKKLLADTRGYTGSFLHGDERVFIKVVVHPKQCQAISRTQYGHAGFSIHQAHQLFSCPQFGKPCMQHHTAVSTTTLPFHDHLPELDQEIEAVLATE
jgi:CheY-specific phosphatase CheX